MSKGNDNPFGALEFLSWNHAWNNYKYPGDEALKKTLDLMKEAGIGIVRMDFLWEDIEPRPAEFKFSKYDRIVDLLQRSDIDILGLLDYTAPWAACDGKWNSPPKDEGLFLNYAAKVIERYKSRVNHWELWNEPDSEIYWSKQDGLKSYCGLLKKVYREAKRIDPGCKILNGGLANGIQSVNQLYENGAKDYFDILNIHFFESPLHAGAINPVVGYPELAYKKMCSEGDSDKPIWLTEIGCPGLKKGMNTGDWWLGHNPGEEEQALWLREIYTELLKNNKVKKIFWAFFRDTNKHWDNGIDYFGIIRWDFSKKPAFEAYKDCFKAWQKKNSGISNSA